MCAFIAAGVVAVVLPSKVLSGGCQANSLSIFQNLDSSSTTAMNNADFCKTVTCKCYVADATRVVVDFPQASTTSTDLTNIQGCSTYTATNSDSVMAGLEKAFTCSGWCPQTSVPEIFYFSDNSDASKDLII